MAYLKTYKELADYFEALPASVTDLKSVTVGADEETLGDQASQIVYPHLRVDTPEILFLNDDQTSATRFTFRFYVLTNEPLKTNAQENQKLSDMATLAQTIHRRLWTDADAGKFDLIAGDKEGDAVRRWSGDNLFGWHFRVVIDLYPEVCV